MGVPYSLRMWASADIKHATLMEDLFYSGTGHCGETVGRLGDPSHFVDKNKTKEEIHPSVEQQLKPSDCYQGGGRGGGVGGG